MFFWMVFFSVFFVHELLGKKSELLLKCFLYSKAVCTVAREYRATILKKAPVGFDSCLQRTKGIA